MSGYGLKNYITNDKRLYFIEHVIKRAKERLLYNLTIEEHNYIVNNIRDQKYKDLPSRSNRRKLKLIKLDNGTPAIVVYCKKRKCLITIMPTYYNLGLHIKNMLV